MKKILITGGTGNLGKQIVKKLSNKDYDITVLSTKEHTELPDGVSLLLGDLTVAKSLKDKLNHFQIIIHCASNPKDSENVDYKGTMNLLQAIGSRHPPHFIYISIVGVDKSAYTYYQSKSMAERMVKASKLPFTIIRITQFHDFVLHRILSTLTNSNHNQPVLKLPQRMAFQPIDIKEAASIISEAVETPQYITMEIGGPEVLSINEIARVYLTRLGISSEIEEYITEDKFYSLFTTGNNLCSNRQVGTVKWSDFVRQSIRED